MVKKHYLNNKDFTDLIIEYNSLCNQYKTFEITKGEDGKKLIKREFLEDPPQEIKKRFKELENLIGTQMLLLINKNASKHTYKDNDKGEMICTAQVDCFNALPNFDPSKKTFIETPNAFSYFTTIIVNAFRRTNLLFFYKSKIQRLLILEEEYLKINANSPYLKTIEESITSLKTEIEDLEEKIEEARKKVIKEKKIKCFHSEEFVNNFKF